MKLLKDGHLDAIIIDGTEFRVKYRHLRPTNEKGEYLPRGGTTVAYILKDEVEIKGVSECSMRDTYRKKLGRIIATGRLLKTLNIPRKQIT
jgi:hypothetical protein